MKIEDIFQTSFVQSHTYHKDYAELESMLKAVEKQNKGTASLETIGKSSEERNIYCLELGNKSSENRVLMVANAHGEEMAGTEELLHIVKTLSENPAFKEFLQDYRFSIIPTINPDAREHNLIWAKSMDLGKFFLDYKRTLGDETRTDLEWGYPIDDKNMPSIKRPEVLAMIQLMNSQKFDLYINLHGAIGTYATGFWYMVEETRRKKDELVMFLNKSGEQTALPLTDIDMGLSCRLLSPGVYGLTTARKIIENTHSINKAMQNCASSFDYFMNKNPESQCICCELPVFYHERYLDKRVSDQKKSDLEKELMKYYLKLWKEKIIPLTEKALLIERHPKLEKYLKNIFLETEPEKSDKKATLGEVRCYEMDKYWLSPGYGMGGYASNLFGKGLGGVIASFPSESRHKLKNIYQICKQESEESAKKAKSLGLRELSLSDSINIQGRTCLGAILTYFKS